LKSEFIKENLKDIYDYMIEDFKENYEKKLNNLLNKKQNYNNFIKKHKTRSLKTNIYNMNYKVNYDYIIEEMGLLHAIILYK
jgi:hypothetical protein